jgi:hypothetical protein
MMTLCGGVWADAQLAAKLKAPITPRSRAERPTVRFGSAPMICPQKLSAARAARPER